MLLRSSTEVFLLVGIEFKKIVYVGSENECKKFAYFEYLFIVAVIFAKHIRNSIDIDLVFSRVERSAVYTVHDIKTLSLRLNFLLLETSENVSAIFSSPSPSLD